MEAATPEVSVSGPQRLEGTAFERSDAIEFSAAIAGRNGAFAMP
jgi:hypothetical protein